MTFDKKLVQTSRGTFSVRERPGNGGSVIALHGWPESSYAWTHVERSLAPSVGLLAPDLLGMGDSPRERDRARYRKDELAKDILALADARGLERFTLVGHDWGGVVAQEMVLAAPSRVERLVLLNTPMITHLAGLRAGAAANIGSGYDVEWYAGFMCNERVSEALIAGREDVWLRNFLHVSNAPAFPKDAFDEYLRYYRIDGTIAACANYYRTAPDDRKRWAALDGTQLELPTLFLYGKQDHFIGPQYFEGRERVFPDLRFVELDANHFVMDEQPETVGRAISGFLQVH